MAINQVETLVLVGLITIIIEMFFMPGLGFLFLGFGSLTTAGIIYNFPNMIEYQYFTVAIISCIWFMILWKPMKNYMHKKKGSEPIFDIIGRSVEVIDSDIELGKIGKVKWSGTIMNARLKEGTNHKAKVGDVLEVVSIEGNVLVLK